MIEFLFEIKHFLFAIGFVICFGLLMAWVFDDPNLGDDDSEDKT